MDRSNLAVGILLFTLGMIVVLIGVLFGISFFITPTFPIKGRITISIFYMVVGMLIGYISIKTIVKGYGKWVTTLEKLEEIFLSLQIKRFNISYLENDI